MQLELEYLAEHSFSPSCTFYKYVQVCSAEHELMQASGKGSFDNNWAQLTAVLPSQILSSDRSSYSDDVLLREAVI